MKAVARRHDGHTLGIRIPSWVWMRTLARFLVPPSSYEKSTGSARDDGISAPAVASLPDRPVFQYWWK